MVYYGKYLTYPNPPPLTRDGYRLISVSLFFFTRDFCSVEIIRLSDKTFKETIKDVELSVLRSTTKEGYISLDPSKPLPHEYEEGKMNRYNENSIYIRKYNVVDAENMATSVSSTDGENENYISLASEYATQVMPETKYQSKIDSEWKISLNSTRFEEMTILRHIDSVQSDDETSQIQQITQSKLEEATSYPNETLAKPLPFVEPNKLRITPNPVTRDTPEVDKLLNGGKDTQSPRYEFVGKLNVSHTAHTHSSERKLEIQKLKNKSLAT